MFNKWLILHFTLNAPLPSGSTEYTPLFVTPDFRTSAQFETTSEIQKSETILQQFSKTEVMFQIRVTVFYGDFKTFHSKLPLFSNSVLIVLRFYLYIFSDFI
jgi:hypothetical protein